MVPPRVPISTPNHPKSCSRSLFKRSFKKSQTSLNLGSLPDFKILYFEQEGSTKTCFRRPSKIAPKLVPKTSHFGCFRDPLLLKVLQKRVLKKHSKTQPQKVPKRVPKMTGFFAELWSQKLQKSSFGPICPQMGSPSPQNDQNPRNFDKTSLPKLSSACPGGLQKRKGYC